MATKLPRVDFWKNDRHQVGARLDFPDGSYLSLRWDSGDVDPVFKGDPRWAGNELLCASLFDFTNRSKAREDTEARKFVNGWDDISTAIEPVRGKISDEERKKQEKETDKEIRELRKSAEDAQDTLEKLANLLAPGFEDGADEQGWCSACLNYSLHKKLVSRAGGSASFVCSACGSPTQTCLGIGCDNFAARDLEKLWLPTWCAEHNHSITGFEHFDLEIDDLSDWNELREFQNRNLKSLTKKSVMIFSAAGVALPIFFTAAPAIGGAIGVAKGYTGIAAINHGLALLGGGAKAAGGLGMAGGKLVISTAGVTISGASAQRAANAYWSQDKSFEIRKHREGTGPAIVYASGWLTEESDNWEKWERLIDTAYPESPVYQVRWGAKELEDVVKVVGKFLTRPGGGWAAATLGLRATRFATKQVTPSLLLTSVPDAIANPWHTAVNRTD